MLKRVLLCLLVTAVAYLATPMILKECLHCQVNLDWTPLEWPIPH